MRSLSFSVVIPTLGGVNIESLLRQLHLSLQEGDEVIIINNGVLDKKLRTDTESYGFSFIHIDESSANRARNIGALNATKDIVAYIDDDVKLTPKYFDNLALTFSDYPNASCVGGYVDLEFEEKPPWLEGPFLYMLSLCDWHKTHPITAYGIPLILNDNTKYLVGASMAIPRDLLSKVQWNENFGRTREDGIFIINDEGDIINDLRGHGDILFTPNVKLYHLISKYRTTVEYLSHRFYRQGISDIVKQTANNPAMTRRQLYNSTIQYVMSNLIPAYQINNARQKIQNEDITRIFIENYLTCRYSYLQGMIREASQIHNP